MTGSGKEALAIGHGHPRSTNLLVTDFVTHDLGGRKLEDAFRFRQPPSRVLYASGSPDEELVTDGVTASAIQQKPFTR